MMFENAGTLFENTKTQFSTLSAFFILAHILVFLANRDKKYIYPKGIFRTGKFTF